MLGAASLRASSASLAEKGSSGIHHAKSSVVIALHSRPGDELTPAIAPFSELLVQAEVHRVAQTGAATEVEDILAAEANTRSPTFRFRSIKRRTRCSPRRSRHRAPSRRCCRLRFAWRSRCSVGGIGVMNIMLVSVTWNAPARSGICAKALGGTQGRDPHTIPLSTAVPSSSLDRSGGGGVLVGGHRQPLQNRAASHRFIGWVTRSRSRFGDRDRPSASSSALLPPIRRGVAAPDRRRAPLRITRRHG